MNNIETNLLQTKLRDALTDASYSQSEPGPHTLVVFLDPIYRTALYANIRGSNYTAADIEGIPCNFETYVGLNGDKALLYWVFDKGIDNIDVFVKYNNGSKNN